MLVVGVEGVGGVKSTMHALHRVAGWHRRRYTGALVQGRITTLQSNEMYWSLVGENVPVPQVSMEVPGPTAQYIARFVL